MDTQLTSSSLIKLEAICQKLNMPTDDVVNLAIARLHNEVFVDQQPDDGPLSAETRALLQSRANQTLIK